MQECVETVYLTYCCVVKKVFSVKLLLYICYYADGGVFCQILQMKKHFLDHNGVFNFCSSTIQRKEQIERLF